MNAKSNAAPTASTILNNINRDKRELYSYTSQDLPFRPSQPLVEPFYINNAILPTGLPTPPSSPIPTYYPVPHSNFDLTNLLSTSSLSPDHYIVNGRTVKPYEVMEHHNEGGNDQSFLIKTNNILSSRESISNLQRLLKDPLAFQQNPAPSFLPGQFDAFISRFNQPPPIQQIQPIQLPRNVPINQVMARPPRPVYNQKHRGPIALGSGSLGYIRLANGAIYIGSGSLGYTNEQQFEERRIPPPPPVRYSLPTAIRFAPNDY